MYETALISSGYTVSITNSFVCLKSNRQNVFTLMFDWLFTGCIQPDSPAELGGKIYEMMAIALGGRWGRSDTEAEATTNEASAEADSSEGTVTEVVEPSEVRPERDPWRD